jgi:single-strand DNA-binding protein
MNKVILIGRAGKDAELADVNGKKKASFTVATSEYWKKDGERKELTTWHNVECWGPLAIICGQYVKKGTTVSVEGKIRNEQWEKDGVVNRRTYILAENVDLLSSSRKGESAGEKDGDDAMTKSTTVVPQEQEDNDDLPF